MKAEQVAKKILNTNRFYSADDIAQMCNISKKDAGQAVRCISKSRVKYEYETIDCGIKKIKLTGIKRSSKKRLTKRERAVFNLLVTEKSNEEIAESLFVCMSTVSFHRQIIYKKLGVNNRIQLIVRYYTGQFKSINGEKS